MTARFVPGSDTEGLERQLQRVGAVGHAHAVRHAAERRELLFALGVVATQDEVAPREHAGNAGIHIGLDGLVLGLQIDKRNLRRTRHDVDSLIR